MLQNSTLYLIPTPIGNLSDMTYRGVQVLHDVDMIYAEDTRTSGILLKHYDIKTPMKSYHKFNEKARCEVIINQLKEGQKIAIISDAGTPGISDPSNVIVKEVIECGFQVVPLPGATAMIPALVASGYDTQLFFMAGFLPHKKKEKDTLLSKLSNLDVPIIFYESPHRLQKFLTEIQGFFNNADICIAREISKLFETFYRGKLNDILNDFDKITLKGEFVIVVIPEKKCENTEDKIIQQYENMYKELSVNKASRQIAEDLGLSKNQVYEVLLKSQ